MNAASPPSFPSPGSFVFPKTFRLLKRHEFLLVQQRGQRMDIGPLLVFVLPRDHLPLRIGLTTSRKVGKAVFRNRLRRLVRDAARRILTPHGADLCFDVVFIAKKGLSSEIHQQDVDQALLTLWKRLQSFKGRKSATQEKPLKKAEGEQVEENTSHTEGSSASHPKTEKK